LVVFLVALPLCLGIALASGAPLFAGIITGVVGGIVVGFLSGSHLAVSGPAAGLTVIVLNGIETLGSYEGFLLAVVIAGIIQLILGFVRAGIIGMYFPTSVIKGMLAAIGLILILKQIPHFLGVDQDYFGDEQFTQIDGENTFTEIIHAFGNIGLGPFIVGLVSLFILVLWERPFLKRNKILSLIPGALVAVVLSILINILYVNFFPALEITASHLVRLPIIQGYDSLINELTFPSLELISNPNLYIVAITIAIIASIETLLSIEATDKLDPMKRRTPNNRELKAQGVGNLLSGLLGGIPMTAVIVRSSANIESGGMTKTATVIHGFLLLGCVMLIPNLLNMIPLSALAAVLLMVGFKLTKPGLYRSQIKRGRDQFIPFIVTVVAILFTDLLIGISIGMVVGIFFILKANLDTPYFLRGENHTPDKKFKIKLSENVSFLNKASLAKTFDRLPEGCIVEIDGRNSTYIDYDVLETIHNFKLSGKEKNIDIILIDIPEIELSDSLH
ncbi:MAG: SulP family inorganic anion transporter, partial [Bacteroidota bacterium]|nr:SulP family inorganic anion transporter [Bacteroidota bacterium]